MPAGGQADRPLDPPTVALLSDLWPSLSEPVSGSFVASGVRALGGRYRHLVLVPRLLAPGLHRRIWGRAAQGWQTGWEAPLPPHRLLRYAMLRVPRGSEVGSRTGGALLAIRQARERPELVHGHFLRSVAPAAVALARRLRVPSVVTAHGTDARWLLTGGIQERFRDEMLRTCLAAGRVIAVSRPIAEGLERLGVPGERIAVISMGVDERVFRIRDRQDARRELGLPPDARVVAFVGRATTEKGFDLLGEALERLHGVTCVAAGPGPLASPPIDRLGPLRAEGVASLIAAADAVCLPSRTEGMPVSVMEALACGRPVVASDVGGIPDQVVPGRNGLLVPAGDAAALANAIEQALGRSWPAEEIRASSQRFWWSVIAERIAAVYDELLGAGGPS